MRRGEFGRKLAVKAVGIVIAGMMFCESSVQVFAAEKFDPAFYATTYADVVNALGTDVNALYNHYLTYGQKEGRLPYAGAKGGAEVDRIAVEMEGQTERSEAVKGKG